MMSVFDRRMEILFMLRRYKSITRTRLASEFSVSDDTIGRDLIALSRYAPICSKLGRYGCIYILEEYGSIKQYLSEDETMVLESLIPVVSDSNRRVLKRIIHKFSIPLKEKN